MGFANCPVCYSPDHSINVAMLALNKTRTVDVDMWTTGILPLLVRWFITAPAACSWFAGGGDCCGGST